MLSGSVYLNHAFDFGDSVFITFNKRLYIKTTRNIITHEIQPKFDHSKLLGQFYLSESSEVKLRSYDVSGTVCFNRSEAPKVITKSENEICTSDVTDF